MPLESIDAATLASLFQLGSGLGVALALFRGPFDRKALLISDEIQSKTKILQNVDRDDFRDALGLVMVERSKFVASKKAIEGETTFYGGVLLVLAVLNTVALCLVSAYPKFQASPTLILCSIGVSVALYGALWLWIELRAHLEFGGILSSLRKIK